MTLSKLILLSISVFFLLTSTVGLALVLQLQLGVLGAPPYIITISELLYWLALLVAAPLWGKLSDHIGKPKVLLFTSLCSSLLLFLFTFASTIPSLLLLRGLHSLAVAGFHPTASAWVSELSTEDIRARRIAVYNQGFSFGIAVGSFLGGWLLDRFGYRHTYSVLAIFSLICTVLSYTMRSTEGYTSIPSHHIQRTPFTSSLLILYLSTLLRKSAIIGVLSLVYVYMRKYFGYSPTLIGRLAALNPLTQIALMLTAGIFADKVGRKMALILGFVTSCLAPITFIYATSWCEFALGFISIGISFAFYISGALAFIGDVTPTGKAGEYMGYFQSAQGIGGMIGPFVAGILAHNYGYTTFFWGMEAFTLIALMLSLLLPGRPTK